uniref:Cyclin-dependent kinases regulatory subunit n=1 Tax=Alexandrium monilatum TaxID=311494 RepID=A0A7S4R7P6_9DINO
MPHYPDDIEYSEKYADDKFEYRHVILPKAIAKDMYKQTSGKRLLEEDEWRNLGVTQSRGWAHYEIHRPEPHILLFRCRGCHRRRRTAVSDGGRVGSFGPHCYFRAVGHTWAPQI